MDDNLDALFVLLGLVSGFSASRVNLQRQYKALSLGYNRNFQQHSTSSWRCSVPYTIPADARKLSSMAIRKLEIPCKPNPSPHLDVTA